jgi:hypothetical protein
VRQWGGGAVDDDLVAADRDALAEGDFHLE